VDPQLDLALLTFARDAALVGTDPRQYRRAVQRGRLVRVRSGSFAAASEWANLSETERYVYRVVAAAVAGRTSPIVSHVSAAVLWGAPVIGPMPTVVHALASVAAGTRTEHGVRKHATAHLDSDVEVRGELRMTGLTRTLAEVAADSSFVTSVGMLDWALAKELVTQPDLLVALDSLDIRRGRRAAVRAIQFADGRSGSPGETLSRVRMHEFGFPAPELQVRFEDSQGLVGITDYYWREFGLIGEFDGVAKYVRHELRSGQTMADVIVAEKIREDRLRALGPKVSRWGWSVAWPQYGLYAHLLSAGLPSSRRGVI
jgi:hypothetical protein